MKKVFETAILLSVLFCASAFAQSDDKPQIAVYVAGGRDAGINRALSTRLLEAFVNSERYAAIEHSGDFLSEIDREQVRQRSGAVDDEQIRQLGKQAGAQFVCVADITYALESYQVSARIIDIETAAVVAMGVFDSPLQTMDDLTIASGNIVAALFGERVSPQAAPVQPEAVQPAARESREGKLFDFYFTPRYMIPITPDAPLKNINLEGGLMWGKGGFVGMEIGVGHQEKVGFTCGAGFNLGYVYDLSAELPLAVGAFVGVWMADENHYTKVGLIGPFIRLRWRVIELSYSGIISPQSYIWDPNTDKTSYEEKISIINHLMLGVHFRTNKRKR